VCRPCPLQALVVEAESFDDVLAQALREEETIPELAKRYGVHASQIFKWKRQLLDNASAVFEPGPVAEESADVSDLL
jgi:transposase